MVKIHAVKKSLNHTLFGSSAYSLFGSSIYFRSLGHLFKGILTGERVYFSKQCLHVPDVFESI